MSGLYIHIPFCRKACTYCDFHFSTSTKQMDRVLEAMHRELDERATELVGATIHTIYFGGGTPSLLPKDELQHFMEHVRTVHAVDPLAEITLEANPDDITPARLHDWVDLGITRLSVGIQSFRDDRLQAMGRAHNAQQAEACLDMIAKIPGLDHSIDLIYGLPGMTDTEWNTQMDIALRHGLPHLSAYCLTVEPGTALHHQVRKGTVIPADDEVTSTQFQTLMRRMHEAGLLHYEISNFARPGNISRHNTAYWNSVPYQGIGPSAHSFSGDQRRWNIANNMRYIACVMAGETYWENETIGPVERTNEMLLTGLRTMWGVRLDALPMDVKNRNEERIVYYMRRGELLEQDGRLVLSEAGRLFADRIASDLFVTDDR